MHICSPFVQLFISLCFVCLFKAYPFSILFPLSLYLILELLISSPSPNRSKLFSTRLRSVSLRAPACSRWAWRRARVGVPARQAALRARSLSLAVACDDRLDSQSSSVVFFDKTCAYEDEEDDDRQCVEEKRKIRSEPIRCKYGK